MQTLKLSFQFASLVIIPTIYFLSLYLAYFGGKFNGSPLSYLGIIVAVFGVTFWITSIINLGTSFGILPKKQKRITRGLYRYFNHPMYIGISATVIGISVAQSSYVGLAFYCLILLPLTLIRARLEEKALS
ncbi:MAG: hypothetical protein A3B38_02605 [Candidatus Levybacteria bacterium RIFCSPLOWO2_01_FULL_36_13]|nr:MAG: hypothetical protein A2684_03800 [Candidatus Levybacteria bacterium RIFCSPHIGHO2_01_FULL_36_15b]OGH35168.1 MAG: hypothetical protein A3B38_02605 [Candidatus Levybacteria bacterium RIFCSPLOWO2_01_FULL_36_13]